MGLLFLREVQDWKKLDLRYSRDNPMDTLYFGMDPVYRVLCIVDYIFYYSLGTVCSYSDDILFDNHFLSHHNSIM